VHGACQPDEFTVILPCAAQDVIGVDPVLVLFLSSVDSEVFSTRTLESVCLATEESRLNAPPKVTAEIL
jgi:hypothetical protein